MHHMLHATRHTPHHTPHATHHTNTTPHTPHITTTGVGVVCLDQNYRSTANVVAASNAVIAPNGKGKTDKQKKQLWTDKPPGTYDYR